MTVTIDVGGGFLGHITAPFDQLTSTLAAMQADIKANAILKIAGAVAILTVSVIALSLIDSAALTKAMAALTVGFGQLVGSMAILDKIATGPMGAAKLVILSIAIGVLAAALILLSVAVKNLSTLGWGELSRGLLGIGGSLGVMFLAFKFMPEPHGTLEVAAAIGLFSLALLLMSTAVKSFSDMEWNELARGLIGTGVALGIMLGGIKILMSNEGGMIKAAFGIKAIAIGLLVMTTVVKSLSELSWDELARGLVGTAGALVILLAAVKFMPEGTMGSALGLVAMSVGLYALSYAIERFAGINYEDTGNGLLGIGAALVVVAAGLQLMPDIATRPRAEPMVPSGMNFTAAKRITNAPAVPTSPRASSSQDSSDKLFTTVVMTRRPMAMALMPNAALIIPPSLDMRILMPPSMMPRATPVPMRPRASSFHSMSLKDLTAVDISSNARLKSPIAAATSSVPCGSGMNLNARNITPKLPPIPSSPRDSSPHPRVERFFTATDKRMRAAAKTPMAIDRMTNFAAPIGPVAILSRIAIEPTN
jgi:hypothetical protein